MKNLNKKRRIAAALASLSLMSAMAMPVATITASADELPEITEEINIDETQGDETQAEETKIPEIKESTAVNTGERGPVTPIQNDKLEKAIESAMKKIVGAGLSKIPVCGEALSGIFNGICGLFEEEPPVPATIEQIDELLQNYNEELKKAISESHDDIIKEISSVQLYHQPYLIIAAASRCLVPLPCPSGIDRTIAALIPELTVA